jgi:hypothetical protein
VRAQGWYLDPYGIHSDRWYSDGYPTVLVRDHGIESYDALPSWQPKSAPVPIPAAQGDGSDLKRADELNWQDQSRDDRSTIRSWLA